MASAHLRHEHRGLRGRLAGLFSTAPSQNGHDEQVAKLTEELQRQRDLKETYKARLESTQGYLRFCLEIAQEHGFLHLISDNAQRQCSPHRDAEAGPASTEEDDVEGDEQAETPPSDPYLVATRDLAVQHGWSVAPDEIKLHEVIGQGTAANIHRATWRGLEVAVKWVRPDFFCTNPSAEAFVAQELDVLSRLRHPHVLRLMAACLRPPESCFLVTELLTGATLGEWLHGGKERRPRRASMPPPPSLADRVTRALEIALAMRYLHEQTPRVLHRDLKPSNVLLGADLRARVADFGHARFLPDGKEALTGETGTYVYMAPEVIRCEPYSEKCDVYSFGIILNELITAEHPYVDTSYGPSKIALEVAAGNLRPRLLETVTYPTGLTDLICRSWDAEPSNRPSFATITSTLRGIMQQIVQQAGKC